MDQVEQLDFIQCGEPSDSNCGLDVVSNLQDQQRGLVRLQMRWYVRRYKPELDCPSIGTNMACVLTVIASMDALPSHCL